MKKETKDLSIVAIGGGTGTYSVLTGLKHYFDNITAVVSMADTGGSARTERDQFGLLPSSDIRKSLVALADTESEEHNLLRELFQYRYTQGKEMKGMTFGNLFLIALTKLLGSQTEAIVKAGNILRIKGRVLPVTLDTVDLVASYENGTQVVGEHLIDEPAHDGKLYITKLSITPKARAYPPVLEAIEKADMVILGPGGLYTTLLANVVIEGIPRALQKTNAQLIYITNLMTEYGQTYEMTVSDHIGEVEKYIGRPLDAILLNSSPMPPKIVAKYEKSHATPVFDDLRDKRVIRGDFLSPGEVKQAQGDTLKRSLIRHDPFKLARTIVKLGGSL